VILAALLLGCGAPCADFAEACRPGGLERFPITDVDRDRSEMVDGFVLVTLIEREAEGSYAAVIDGAGRPVWWYETRRTQKVLRARLDRDGQAVTIGTRHPDNGIQDGAFLRVDRQNGELLDEVAVVDNHHEHVELPDGRIAFLSRDRVPDEWFGAGAPIAMDVVRVFDFADGVSEVLFDLAETLDLEPFWTCSHMRRGAFIPDTFDWTHTNSLVYDDDTGAFTLGIRHFDSVVRLTGEGELAWWLGAPFAPSQSLGGVPVAVANDLGPQLEPVDGALRPRHAHFSDAWSDGLLVFDNGNHAPRASRVVQYALDETGQTYREVWSLVDPEGRQFKARGDAIRLPGGNVLITWSSIGELWEVTPAGDVVWKARSDLTVVRSLYFEDW